MKVKMNTTMAGPNGTFVAGSVADLPTAQAYDLCERGYAVQIEDAAVEVEAEAPAEVTAPAEVETAMEAPAEVAASVTIPDDWRKLPAGAMRTLAGELGTEAGNKKQAVAAIEAAGG